MQSHRCCRLASLRSGARRKQQQQQPQPDHRLSHLSKAARLADWLASPTTSCGGSLLSIPGRRRRRNLNGCSRRRAFANASKPAGLALVSRRTVSQTRRRSIVFVRGRSVSLHCRYTYIRVKAGRQTDSLTVPSPSLIGIGPLLSFGSLALGLRQHHHF